MRRKEQHMGTAIFHTLNLKPQIEFIDMPKDLISQYQNFTQADISRLRNVGYKERFYELEEGVGECAKSLDKEINGQR